MSEEDYWQRIVGLYQKLIDHRIMPLVVTEAMMAKAEIPQHIIDTFVRQRRLIRCRCINDDGYKMERNWRWTSLKGNKSVLHLPKRIADSVKER